VLNGGVLGFHIGLFLSCVIDMKYARVVFEKYLDELPV